MAPSVPQHISAITAITKKTQPEKIGIAVSGSIKGPFIPPGWTYLAHGTNLLRQKWDDSWRTFFDRKVIRITSEASVITREQQEQEALNPALANTTASYASIKRPKGMSGEEFAQRSRSIEIRVIFFKDLRSYPEARNEVLSFFNNSQEARIMGTVRDYYEDLQHEGHPHIPSGTRLIKIEQTKEGDRDILYCIPEALEDLYTQSLAAATFPPMSAAAEKRPV